MSWELATALTLLAFLAAMTVAIAEEKKHKRESEERYREFRSEMKELTARHFHRPCTCALSPYGESNWTTPARLCPRHGRRQ